MSDRKRTDHDIAAGLNIIQAAANLSLIHDLATVSDTAAELASDLYAAYGQADADHGTIGRLAERLAEMGARIHAVTCEREAYRRQLALLQARVYAGVA